MWFLMSVEQENVCEFARLLQVFLELFRKQSKDSKSLGMKEIYRVEKEKGLRTL